MAEQKHDENQAAEEEFELTPEIVQYENRRNDLILAVGVLALAFFLGAFKEAGPDLWLRFKSGEWIAKNFPSLAQPDPFSYTASEVVWTNPSWLFDWTIFQIYARAGDAMLIVLKALVAVVVAGSLLTIRYPGPTQWWTNLCALLAMVSVSLQLGLRPQIATLALFALLMVVWFQSRYRGRPGLAYAAIPLAIVWANVDASYVLVFLTLLAIAIGDAVQAFLPAKMNFEDKRPPMVAAIKTLVVAAVCLAVGAATPYGLKTLTFPYEWITQVVPQVAPIERIGAGWTAISPQAFVDSLLDGRLDWSQYAWALLLFATVGSFFLNYNNLQVSRLLLAAGSVALAFAYAKFIGHSSIALAAILSINCQEFFLENWGTETRVTRGWLLWSQLGRACSIIVVFGAILGAFTGRIQGYVDRFGFGIENSRYMLEANQWLDSVGFQGKPFAFLEPQASFMTYARPERSTFFDSRWDLFVKSKGDGETSALAKFRKARNALKDGKPEDWKPIFDEYGVTHVIIEPTSRVLATTLQMLNSSDLAPLFVSDRALVFGRVDDHVDSELVSKHRIEANRLAFRSSRGLPRPTDRYVESPGIIDWVWRSRYNVPPSVVSGSIFSGAHGGFEQPGAQFMAISELRNAISANPDNPDAYLQLAVTYDNLYRQEAYHFALEQRRQILEYQQSQENAVPEKQEDQDAQPQVGKLTAEDIPLVMPPASSMLPTRHFQIMAALQNSLTAGARGPRIHLMMAEVCRTNELFDLALHHMQTAYDMADANTRLQMEDELLRLKSEVDERLEAYNESVTRMETELDKAGANSDLPFERARWASRYQLPKLASEQLDSLSPLGPEMDEAAPFAAALYLRIGRIEEAESFLTRMKMNPAQGALASGEWEWSMAQVHILLGQYASARDLLEHAIAEVRSARLRRTMQQADKRIRNGELFSTIEERGESFGDIEREAGHLFTLGLLRLEMGEPTLAPEAFGKSLELMPDSQYRPVIEFYWPLLTDDELPPRPEPYDPKLEIAQRLEPPKEESGDEASDPPAEKTEPAEPVEKAEKTEQAEKAEEKPAESPE